MPMLSKSASFVFIFLIVGSILVSTWCQEQNEILSFYKRNRTTNKFYNPENSYQSIARDRINLWDKSIRNSLNVDKSVLTIPLLISRHFKFSRDVCPDSNAESYRSKQARYQLSHPSPLPSHPAPSNLATHLPPT